MTNNNNSQNSSTSLTTRGFALPMIIAIIALVVIVAGIGYFATRTQPSPTATTQTPSGEKTLPDGTVVKADGTMVKPDGTMVKPDGTMVKKEGGAMMGQLAYNFTAQNNSGETGTVTFSQAQKDTTNVVIALNGAPKGVSQPAHIHVGSCKTLGAASHPLTNVVNGKSETILDISYDNLWKEVPFAVNVHKSSAEAKIYTACADVIKEGAMMKKEGETIMKKEDGTMMAKYTGTVLAGKSAPLLDYNKADYDAAVKSDKLVVLYFYANWCPICKAETANALYPEFNKLTSDKVVGFRVNYNDSDTDSNEKALASQFGVAYQHTKVFVKNGTRILKSPEGWDDKRYDMEINKALTQ